MTRFQVQEIIHRRHYRAIEKKQRGRKYDVNFGKYVRIFVQGLSGGKH